MTLMLCPELLQFLLLCPESCAQLLRAIFERQDPTVCSEPFLTQLLYERCVSFLQDRVPGFGRSRDDFGK